ncbi:MULTISPECIES: FMN-binding glutamate synthase family protein [unclassified Variovorax]|jgi:glutamate synthase domain-containing protein 2|uniref:FMN-binding glutamate synthase family protein n=1 Tax=unclassified Variovorax TaxID=663243 RepID=UPI0008E71D5C|nr:MULTISPECIES: FMN-binding glutamate synthase family protein [unclassified Variovorax]KAF1061415.1 MAG: Glutamate synthase [NADPH] large chain [Variovorax sp.]TAJ62205.1 MAG: FMN-binding glutamate synthase family protein [Variovorax sp.]SFP45170.1 Glutamate synthase domain-containing protein 2 [Variovorax sp. PDC80]
MPTITPFPVRYTAFALCVAGFAASLAFVLASPHLWFAWLALVVFAVLAGTGVHDLRQTRHAILRNYPVIGHLRFLLEFIRPEIRQYFIESDAEAAPFSRAQRSLVYQRAKGEPDNRPFGTQLNVTIAGYEWINHSMQPTKLANHDFRIVIGGTPQPADANPAQVCTQPYSASVFNISAMSFGALSANAILALNQGAKSGGFAHDTGEGSISQHHRVHGGDLIWEIGSGYFGCRNEDGTFSEERFIANARDPQVKMIEIKLSQGAKPGHGGVLPAPKVTPEIAAARGVPIGVDCISPSSHSAFSTPTEMMHFVARLRELSGGKPTGFKFCLGHPWEWFGIVKAMQATGITPDFIVVDGAEGGTGAAPVEFSDHVGAPLQEGLLLVHNTLLGVNLRHRIKLGCAGKVITAFDLARMMALGADWCNAGRGFMMALGCIQAQSCHTGHCPTGVTTQDPVRQQALVVPTKAERVRNFHRSTLHALQELVQAAGLDHPQQITAHHIVRRISDTEVRLLSNLVMQVQPGALLGPLDEQHNVFRTYWPLASADSFQPLTQGMQGMQSAPAASQGLALAA